MSLSACLIVRDEERFLDRCLASLRGHVDEICVLDTGSSDRTVEIARSHGAVLGHRPWDDDFSAARNASLDLASGDWILQIDADEELVPPGKGAWSMLDDRRAVCALVELELRGDEGRSERTWQPRLFRRDPRLRYQRPLHETVLDGLAESGLPAPVPCGLLLIHHGYASEIVSSRGKIERNLRILRAWRDRGLADAYDEFKLASALETLPFGEASTELDDAWNRCLAIGRESPAALRSQWPWWPRAVAAAARHHQSFGKIQQALQAFELIEALPAIGPEILAAHAELLLASGRPAAALERLGASPGQGRLRGLCLEAVGDPDGAWSQWSLAEGHDALKARLLARLGRVEESVAQLSLHFGAGPRDPDAFAEGIAALLDLGETSTALSLLANPPPGSRRHELRILRLRRRVGSQPFIDAPMDFEAAAEGLVRDVVAGVPPHPFDVGFDRSFLLGKIADLLQRKIDRGEETAVRTFARRSKPWEEMLPGIARLVEDDA